MTITITIHADRDELPEVLDAFAADSAASVTSPRLDEYRITRHFTVIVDLARTLDYLARRLKARTEAS